MNRIILFLFTLLFISTIQAKPQQPKIIWTSVFSHITPRNNQVSKTYCISHTPTVVVTTMNQITSKDGVRALNDIYLKYKNYKSVIKNGIRFNYVDAILSGKDKNGSWSTPIKLYQQTLSEKDMGITWVVWSTKYCKGMFLGTPTVIKNT